MLLTIKLTIAAVVALAPMAFARMHCAMMTFDSTINSIQLESLGDLSGDGVVSVPWEKASVTLTPKYYDDVNDADQYIRFTHFGSFAGGHLCNYVGGDDTKSVKGASNGTDCAWLVHQDQQPSTQKRKTAGVAVKESIEFNANLTDGEWWTELAGTGANQTFSLTAPMKVITFSSHVPHRWIKATVKLDAPDFSFTKGWLCAYDSGTTSAQPRAQSKDGITWEIDEIGFVEKDSQQNQNDLGSEEDPWGLL